MPTREQTDTLINDALTQQGSSDRITGIEIREAHQHGLDYVDQQDAALADDIAQVAEDVANLSGIELSTPTAFDGTIRLDKLNRTATVDAADITGPITFDATDAANGASYTLEVVADGVTAEPDVSDFHEIENTAAYDNTDGNSTAYIFNRVAGVNVIGRIRLGESAVIIQLATPSLSLTVDSDDAITGNWTNVSNEASYVFQIATDAGFTTGVQTSTPAVNVTTHQFTGLTASTLYYARVKAVGDGVSYYDSAYGSDSDTTQAAGLTPLSAPTLTMSIDSPTAATGTWTNVANESSFTVDIATNAGFTTGLQTASKSANTLTHQFTGLTPATVYYMRVKAVGDGVTYSDSTYGTDNDTTASLTTPAAPTAFVVDDTLDTADWTNSAGYTNPTDYEYRIGGAGAFTGITAKPHSVGDVDIAIGDMEIRVKAVAGVSNASASLTNGTAFTAAAVGGVPLTFTTRAGDLTNAGTDFSSASHDTNAQGLDTLYLPASTDGIVYAEIVDVTGASPNVESYVLGFDPTNALQGFATIKAGVFPGAANIAAVVNGAPTGTLDTSVVGEFWGIRRKVSGELWIVKSLDEVTFTDIYDTGLVDTGILYVVCQVNYHMHNPKGINLV